jgi:hypothetical protein
VSRRDLGEPLGPRARDGLGALADLLGRTLPGPDLGERGEVGSTGGRLLKQSEDLLVVGGDVLAAIRLAERDPHDPEMLRRADPHGGTISRGAVPPGRPVPLHRNAMKHPM